MTRRTRRCSIAIGAREQVAVENLDAGHIECVCLGAIAAGPDETADPAKAAIHHVRDQPRSR